MNKLAQEPKLKDFFEPEPLCKVHGSATKCLFGRAPSVPMPGSLPKKAEYVFAKIAAINWAKKSK